MKKIQTYNLNDDEYKYFEDAVMHIDCPDLGDHDCSLCPMNVNINYRYPKDPEYRCLLSLMEDKLYLLKAMNER